MKTTFSAEVNYGPRVGGEPVHPITGARLFRGQGPAWPGGRGLVIFSNLQFYTETSLPTTMGTSQVPQRAFLAAGFDLLAINLPPVRGGASPVPESQDPEDFNPAGDEFGDAFNGNGVNTKSSGDAATWPGPNPTTNSVHPLVDPTWLSAHRCMMDAVQWAKDNAAAYGWSKARIVTAGDSAGAQAALWAACQPDRAGKLGGEGTQPNQSTRVAGFWCYRPGTVYLGTLAHSLDGWLFTDSGNADGDEPADTLADVDATVILLESVVRFGANDPSYPTIQAENNALAGWIGSASPMSAAAAADANRYVTYPVKTETNTHSILAGYIAKSKWPNWRLTAVTGAEDVNAGSVTNGVPEDLITDTIEEAYLDGVQHITGLVRPPIPAPARIRDIHGSVVAWLMDRLQGVLAVIDGDLRIDTMGLPAYARVTVEHELDAGPYGTVRTGRGVIELDVRSARNEPGAGSVRHVSRVRSSIDRARAVLERQRLPVFNLLEFDDRAGLTGSLASAVTEDDDELVVTAGDAFDFGPWEVVIGGERIAYDTRVDGSGTTTLSTLTRGLGDTVAAAHPAGSSVADALGEPIGLLHVDGFKVRPLPYDVAEQRSRALVQVPFRSDHPIL